MTSCGHNRVIGTMDSIMSQVVFYTSITCIAAWVLEPLLEFCPVRPKNNWKPFGIYKGHILYERIYDSGKKSWRYAVSDGHVYLSNTAMQNENIMPL